MSLAIAYSWHATPNWVSVTDCDFNWLHLLPKVATTNISEIASKYNFVDLITTKRAIALSMSDRMKNHSSASRCEICISMYPTALVIKLLNPSRWYTKNTNLCISYELGSNYSMGFVMYPHPINLKLFYNSNSDIHVQNIITRKYYNESMRNFCHDILMNPFVIHHKSIRHYSLC